MARRKSETSTTTEAPAEVTTPTQEEAVVTDTTTEAPVENADAPSEAAKSGKPEVKIDLTAFNTAVSTAVDSRDETTGIVAEEPLQAVTKAYRDLDGIKPKKAAKDAVAELLKDAVNNLDMPLAKAYMSVTESLTAGTSGSKPAAPVDPTEAYTQRLAVLDLAYGLVAGNVPEGVDGEVASTKAAELRDASSEAAASYLAWLQSAAEDKGDEPEASAVVKAAAKLATGRAAKVGGSGGTRSTFTGQRRDIGEHIRQAFENQPSGTFMTVAEIRAFQSTEYGQEKPSAGAISARLFPKSGKTTLDFVIPGQNEKSNHGATKK